MRIFRKHRTAAPAPVPTAPPSVHGPFDAPDRRAVPLVRADVEALVTAYTESDRLTRLAHSVLGSGGTSYARHQAAAVMRAAALAGALGQDTVPMPVPDVDMLEHVHNTLQGHAPGEQLTRDFGLLILKLQALSALCGLNGWHYEHDHEAKTVRWVTPVAAGTAARALPPGSHEGRDTPMSQEVPFGTTARLCEFCSIVAGDDRATVVHEWPDALAILPRRGGVTAGHVLILPRVHVLDASTDPAVTAAVMGYAAELMADMPAANLITSKGAPASQTVFHLHVHVVPRRPGDGLPLPWSPHPAPNPRNGAGQ
jgi:histidine triad (HIT) family protein